MKIIIIDDITKNEKPYIFNNYPQHFYLLNINIHMHELLTKNNLRCLLRLEVLDKQTLNWTNL